MAMRTEGQRRRVKRQRADMFHRAYEAAALYEAGKTTGDIAKALKVTYCMVYKYLKMEDVMTRRAKTRASIIKLYRKDRLPAQEIATKLGFSLERVRRGLAAEGLIA